MPKTASEHDTKFILGWSLPVPERENEIHKWDITEGLPYIN